MRHRTSALFAWLAVTSLSLAACGDDDAAPGEVVVKIDGDSAVNVGETITLSAITFNGVDDSYVWSSSNEGVATVDASGTVTGVTAGTAIITAVGTGTEVSDTHGVVVLEPGATPGDPVVVVDVGMHEVPIGDTTTATATTVGVGDETYTWMSSNPDVATVDADGTVTGVSTGETIISATGMESGATGEAGIVVVPDFAVPNLEEWMGSAHADRSAEAFLHWSNDDDMFEVSTTCARCHTSTGFQDYIGADGSAVGSVESPVDVSGGPDILVCQTCHNAAAQRLSTVTFPSGVEISGLGPSARCMTCHQGRESTPDLDDEIGTAGPDEVLAEASFVNIHYKQAGATLHGTLVMGGYQYAGKLYDGRFQHFTGIDTCTDCHDPHSLELQTDKCQGCHTGVTSAEAARDIRMIVSQSTDYDGDGDLTEGIFYELQTLRENLLTEIQSYATATTGTDDICYANNYPYWFADTDGDGTCSDTEAAFGNRYSTWTPRLLRAAYNYQFEQTDPGDFAHNAKYVIQLLHDSIEDLGGDVTGYTREDPGHFNGAAEAFRHWDEDPGFVEPDCSRCHGGLPGFEFELQHGVGTAVELTEVNGLQCQICHTADVDFVTDTSVRQIEFMEFPSGARVRAQTLADADPDNTFPTFGDQGILCGQCHSGRNSRSTVEAYIAATPVADLEFRAINIHYLPAAATMFGSVVEAGYEYPGNTYAGEFGHAGNNVCTFCHQPAESSHTFLPSVTRCQTCHGSGVSAFEEIRLGSSADYDGDGDTAEGLGGELETLRADLLAQLAASATTGGGAALCYAPASYPYFFVDTDTSGTTCDASEATFGNRYTDWTPELIRAAHNYQLARKDPGSYVHNFPYIAQLVIDSIEALGGSVAGYVRP